MDALKKSCLFVICLLIASVGAAQTVKVENGIAFSALTGNLYGKRILSYQFSIGMDYCERRWFDLSSNIGLVSKGGCEEVPYMDAFGDLVSMEFIDLRFRYLTMNTLFRFKYTEGRWTVYAGAGPNLGVRLNTHFICSDSDLFSIAQGNGADVIYGMDCVCGGYYELGKFQFGLNFCYPWTFNKVYKSIADAWVRDRTFSLGLALGYAF